MSFLTLELVGKRIELLREFMPQVKRIAALANPQHPGDQAERRVSEGAAKRLGLELRYVESRNVGEVEPALAAIVKSGSQAAVMFPFATIMTRRRRIAEWAIEHRIPAVSGWAQFAEGGNLLSYGPNLRDSFRRLATFVDKVLRGAKPGDIPVELPSSVELVVNQRAARALGLKAPASILQRADRVIE
jgi:putative ABC transport system substrate-binding protein